MNRISGALILYLSIAAIGCGPGGDWDGWLKGRDSWALISDGVVRERLPRLSKTGTKELQIERATLREEDMAMIGALQNLTLLRISNCRVDEGALRHIRELRKLRRARITLSGVDDEDVASLSELAELEEVELVGNELTDASMRYLAKLPKLKHLKVSSGQVDGSGFRFLANIHTLQNVDASDSPIVDVSMKYLASHRGLRALWLGRTNVTDVGLMEVSGNYWLLNVVPSKHMTVEGMREFREKLLEGRRKAREAGLDVPPDDTLYIQTDKDPEVRGALPPRGYPKPRDE